MLPVIAKALVAAIPAHVASVGKRDIHYGTILLYLLPDIRHYNSNVIEAVIEFILGKRS